MQPTQPNGPYLGPDGTAPPPQIEAGRLVGRIRSLSKISVLGILFGVPLTAGGTHYGITRAPTGFAAALIAALIGAALLAGGLLGYARVLRLRRRLRTLLPAGRRSPIAHLPSARRAATLAAYLNGVLVLLGLGGAGWLLFMGGSWGAYGNPFGFGALAMGVVIPLSLGLAAASTLPDLLRVVPLGARTGQGLYGVFVLVAVPMIVKGDGPLPRLAGAAIAAVALGAAALLGRCYQRMGGPETQAGARPGEHPPERSGPGFGPAPAPPTGAPHPHPGPYGNPPQNPPHAGTPYGPSAPRRGRGGLVLTIVLVLVLLAGGGGLFAAKKYGLLDGDGVTTDVTENATAPAYGIGGAREAQWAAPATTPEHSGGFLVNGGDGVTVHLDDTTATGYDLATGKQSWEIKDRSGAFHLCAVSPTAAHEVIALVMRRGTQGPCGAVVAIDTRSGKQLWSRQILATDDRSGMGGAVVRVTRDVVVTGTRTAPVVLDARTGHVRWTGADQPLADGEARTLGSLDVTGDTLVASYEGDSADPSTVLRRFDLRTGRVTERIPAPKPPRHDGGAPSTTVVNADPLVVALEPNGGFDHFTFARTGGAWKLLHTEAVHGLSPRLQDRQPGMVAGGVLVQAYRVDDPSLDVGFDSVVVGFDLESGAPAWQHTLHRDAGDVILLPGTVKGAIRAVASDNDTGLQLYAFPLTGGEPVRGGRLTIDPALPGAPPHSGALTQAVVQGDRLVVSDEANKFLASFPFPRP
ncbi:PQQ-binding-like beta-propeller repeat protein [Streptomyces sp. NPDC048718]|uniref:outer membrane protein assembly factor BamB family protein n=1 Tax=Streptomyces sp. NPDC048718 TaxID=3365587 RepID=UPI00371C5620